jgi:hypothetical protein
MKTSRSFTARADALLQVDRRAPLLIHDADLERIGFEVIHRFDTREQRIGERSFVRSVHLGLDDVDAAEATVGQGTLELAVRDRASGRHDRIEDALENLVAVPIEHGIVGHEMTDIADQQQAAPGKYQRFAVGSDIVSIGVQATQQ